MNGPDVTEITTAPRRRACLVEGCACKDARILSTRRAGYFASIAASRGETADRRQGLPGPRPESKRRPEEDGRRFAREVDGAGRAGGRGQAASSKAASVRLASRAGEVGSRHVSSSGAIRRSAVWPRDAATLAK